VASEAIVARKHDFDPNAGADDGNPLGMPEAEITHAVDVSAFLDAKRESLRAHRSQVTDTGYFLDLPEEAFDFAFGTEWFILKGADPGPRPGWLFE
jgi:LmbE family N-acetylglucosaminyl deacetylase